MSQANLLWTPAGGANSLSQDVQYKQSSSSTWITHSNVGPTITTAVITGIVDNTLYDYRIVDNCSVGGPTAGAIDTKIKFICPSVTVGSTYNTVTYSFTHVGGSITKYIVDLLNTDGSAVIASIDENSPSGTVSNVFSGLTAVTEYQVRVTMVAGSFNNACTATHIFTATAPTCSAPTGVSATIS